MSPQARGQAPGLLREEPGDSLQIGADLVDAVGEYETPNGISGALSGVVLKLQAHDGD